MARITVEDCLQYVDNRFALVHLATQRARQLLKGTKPFVTRKNKETVLALREIAIGKVRFDKSVRDVLSLKMPAASQLPVAAPVSPVSSTSKRRRDRGERAGR